MDCIHNVKDLDNLAWEVRTGYANQPKRSWFPNIPTPRGLKFLGSGISRIGYLMPCGKHCLKVSYGPDRTQTFFEIEKWNQAQDNPFLLGLLCPIDLHDDKGIWELMPYAPELGHYPVKAHDKMRFDLMDILEAHDISDLHGGNVGWLNGKLVAIDYGIGSWTSTGFGIEEDTFDKEMLTLWGK